MRASRLAAFLCVFVLLPGAGRAQTPEGAAQDDAWTPYPDTGAAASPTPGADTSFEPIGFPGETEPGDGAPVWEDPRGAPVDVQPSTPLSTPEVEVAPTFHQDAVKEAPSGPREPAAEGLLATPGTFDAGDAPAEPLGFSSRDTASGPTFFPSSEAPRYASSLAPEPLAVPLLRSLLDVAGAGVATLGTAVLMDLVSGTRCFRERETLCALNAFVVTFLSISATAPVGVWAVGSMLGGEGKLWAAYMGSAIGMGLGVIGTMPTLAFGHGAILAFAGPIGAVLGATIAYEVSHRLSRRQASLVSERSSGVRVTPVLGATPRGNLLGGLAGSF